MNLVLLTWYFFPVSWEAIDKHFLNTIFISFSYCQDTSK